MRALLYAFAAASAAVAQNAPAPAGDVVAAVRPLRDEPKVTWETKPRYRDSSALAAANGVLVTGNTSGTGGTFAYDLATGKQLWSVPGHIRGGPAIAGGFAYAVNDTRDRYRFALRKLDLRTGKAAWSAVEEDLGNHDGPPVVVGNQIALTSRSGAIAAYDVATGARLWQHTGTKVCDGRISSFESLVFFSGGLAGTDHTLTALDAATGATTWSVVLAGTDGKGCGTGTVVANGLVVTGLGRDLLAYDARTGDRKWARMVAATVGGRREDLALSSLVVSDGVVYAASPSRIIGSDLDTGRAVFEFALPVTAELGTLQLASAGPVLYVHANGRTPDGKRGASTIYAVDVAEKRVLWTHHAGRADQYDPIGSWATRFVLPIDGGLVYENSQLLVRLGS
jgi:outer membrane protein assembly factor BamB